jgi:probable rRNA maturation factor
MVRPRVVLARQERHIRPAWPPIRRVLQQILLDHERGETLSVALVDDATITRLHDEYLGEPTPTDVISFPLLSDEDGPPSPERVLGEVVVSAETAHREAKKRGLEPERELALYAIHGTLHLVGFDDLEPRAKRRMRRAEKKYLALYDEAVGR